uniref:Uncharacterized protein n=1 Tax=Arundo donax TaxID=35708 RepID=A0A0A9CI08_ARUDO
MLPLFPLHMVRNHYEHHVQNYIAVSLLRVVCAIERHFTPYSCFWFFWYTMRSFAI